MAAALLAASVLAAAALVAHLEVPVVDDAAISIAYGWTFWTGHGLRLTPASAVAEGFSNPLWTLIVGLTPLLADDAPRATGTISIALALAALPLWACWGPLAAGRSLRIEDALAPALAATSTSYAYWAAAGLEGSLFSFLLALGGALLLRDLRRRPGTRSGATAAAIVFGLVCLTRPEGVVYAAVALGFFLAVRRAHGTRFGPRDAVAVGAGAFIALGWVVFRWAYFAAWVPNTYYAKFGLGDGGWDYLRSFAAAFPTTVGALASGIITRPLLGRASGRPVALALAFVAASAYFAVRAGGDWMREWRFLAPFVPAAGACVAGALSAIRDRAARAPRRSRRLGERLGMACVALLGVAVLQEAWEEGRARIRENREHPTLGVGVVAHSARQLRELLDRLGLVRPRVGLPDVGGNGLVLRHAEIVDVGALCDVAIARSFHDNPRATEDYLVHEGLPTILDIHGPSGALHRMRELMRHYVPIHQVDPTSPLIRDIWIVRGLTREHDPRCPGSLAAVRAMDVAALARAIDDLVRTDAPDDAIRLYRCAREHREHMPEGRWHAEAAQRAAAASIRAEARGELERALRFASLATILSHQNAWHRRRTEALRARLWPPPGTLVPQRRWF